MPPGRLLDPASDDGARGMIVTAVAARRPQGRACGEGGDRIRLTVSCGGPFGPPLSLSASTPGRRAVTPAHATTVRDVESRHSLSARRGMAHFLVTGGAGFIGSHLAEELVAARTSRPRCGRARSRASAATSMHVTGVEFLQGDLADLAFARTGSRRASTSCCTRRPSPRCRGRSPIR